MKEVRRNRPSNQFKFNRIKEILCDECDVDIVYFLTELEEKEALQIEYSLIKTIGTENLTNISGGTAKPSAKEHALYMLSNMLPYNTWVERHPEYTDFEKGFYSKIKEAWEDISKNGFVYSMEQRRVNGELQLIEKRRM
jgi:hypothetical protein